MPSGTKPPIIKPVVEKPVVKKPVAFNEKDLSNLKVLVDSVKTQANTSYDKNKKRILDAEEAESAGIDEQFAPKSGGEALDENGNPFGDGTLSPDGLLVAVDGIWVETSFVDTNKDGIVSEEEAAAFEGSLDQDEVVIEETEEVVEEGGDEVKSDTEVFAEASAKSLEDQQKNNPVAKAKTKAEKISANYKKAVDESTKGIDSNRVLTALGNNGFAAIGMALAVMGSALGSALTGSKGNAAMDAINRIIDQDIADQKFNRNLKLKKAGALRKDLDKALSDEQKQKTLDGLKRYKYLSAVRSQVEMKMFSTNDPKKKAAFKKQLGIIDKQLSKIYGDFTIDVTKFVISEENKVSATKAKTRAAAVKKAEEIKKRTILVNGREIVIKTSATPKKIVELQDKAASVNKSNKIIGQLLNFDKDLKAGKYGKWTGKWDKELGAKIAPLQRFLAASIRPEVLGPGVVDKTERAILEKMAANPQDLQLWNSKEARTALLALKKVVNESAQEDFRAWAEPGTFKDFKSKKQKKGLKDTTSVGETRISKKDDSLTVAKNGQRRTTKNGEEVYNGFKWVPYNG